MQARDCSKRNHKYVQVSSNIQDTQGLVDYNQPRIHFDKDKEEHHGGVYDKTADDAGEKSILDP